MNENAAEARFKFGENWKRFLSLLNEGRISEAEESLKNKLGVENLKGKSFLDIGSGSGLFSLAARRLGARVHSFDYDPQSVACAEELKARYFADDPEWTIEQGSALDREYMQSLGTFDIVYSWGVLHHTGNMWQALENAIIPTQTNGQLFISIYNDQGAASHRWLAIKKLYNRSSPPFRLLLALISLVRYRGIFFVKDLLSGHPFRSWREYGKNRGMSPWHDIIDWVGGLPFEVAKPEEIFSFYKSHGFDMETLSTCAGGLGCNEFVFRRKSNKV